MAVPAFLLPTVIEIGKELIERLVPDKNKRAEAQAELNKLILEKRKEILDATKSSDAGQVSINVEEAKATDLFRAGWRPFVGWVCGFAVAYQFLARPLLTWLSPVLLDMSVISTPPSLDMADLIFLLGGMLGLGTLRTIEKKSGVG